MVSSFKAAEAKSIFTRFDRTFLKNSTLLEYAWIIVLTEVICFFTFWNGSTNRIGILLFFIESRDRWMSARCSKACEESPQRWLSCKMIVLLDCAKLAISTMVFENRIEASWIDSMTWSQNCAREQICYSQQQEFVCQGIICNICRIGSILVVLCNAANNRESGNGHNQIKWVSTVYRWCYFMNTYPAHSNCLFGFCRVQMKKQSIISGHPCIVVKHSNDRQIGVEAFALWHWYIKLFPNPWHQTLPPNYWICSSLLITMPKDEMS